MRHGAGQKKPGSMLTGPWHQKASRVKAPLAKESYNSHDWGRENGCSHKSVSLSIVGKEVSSI